MIVEGNGCWGHHKGRIYIYEIHTVSPLDQSFEETPFNRHNFKSFYRTIVSVLETILFMKCISESNNITNKCWRGLKHPIF